MSLKAIEKESPRFMYEVTFLLSNNWTLGYAGLEDHDVGRIQTGSFSMGQGIVFKLSFLSFLRSFFDFMTLFFSFSAPGD